MSSLYKYANSSRLMRVTVNYGKEVFKFNLFKEIRINEEDINKELQGQPSAYAFLTMLQAKLITRKSEADSKMKRAYAKAYIKYKTDVDPSTGRVYAKELSNEKAELDMRFVRAQRNYISATEDLNTINACVRGFEQRKDILQTLSANQRKERV